MRSIWVKKTRIYVEKTSNRQRKARGYRREAGGKRREAGGKRREEEQQNLKSIGVHDGMKVERWSRWTGL